MKGFQYQIEKNIEKDETPISLLVKCAASCESDVMIQRCGNLANAKRLFAVTALNLTQGDEIQLTFTGSTEAVDSFRLKDFCEQNL